MNYGTYLRRVSANIQKARWVGGLTQEQVAARGIKYRYYQELEAGRRNPSLEMLFRLAGILGTTVAAIVDVGAMKGRVTSLEGLEPTAPKPGRKPKRQRRQISR